MNIVKKHIAFFLFVIVSLSSFAQNQEQMKKDYEKAISLYPNKLTSHFLDFKEGTILYLDFTSPGASSLNNIYAIFLCKEEQVETIKKEVKLKALRNYHFIDSCLMIVNYDSTLYDSAVCKFNLCGNFSNMLPVPNFQFCVENPFPKDFYEKASIYVLGANKGKYLSEKYLWNKGVGLPPEWLNGYTKGVVISGNLVVYWLEVW